ncbi:MAG: hypothetical protein ACYTG0_43170 [Planctomycetota bacterium]|jgi:hypothetical protein
MMSDDEYKAEQASGTRSDVSASESGSAGEHPMRFDCGGIKMDDAMAVCPCISIKRRHPVVTSAILAVMGLAVFMIPAGAILGIIAFLRTL